VRITDLLLPESIALRADAASKEEAMETLIALMKKSGAVTDLSQYRKDVWKREEEGTTGIGEGIAIPHAKSSAVKRAALCAMTVPAGVEFQALDGMPSKLFFLIAAPDTAADTHLEVLSRLSTLLMDGAFREKLLSAETPEEFLEAIDRQEREKYGEPSEKEAGAAPKRSEEDGGYEILAVTACPTGIAHTYMAAESLEQKAAQMGLSFKVETDGSGGAKNLLTAEEIRRARCIIIAADRDVEMERFDGKPVLRVKVADGIHRPEELLRQAVEGNAPVYHGRGEGSRAPAERESAGRRIYKHLMNGVSHMLPFVIGGGILIALAFLLDDYTIDPANFGSNTPVAAFFKSVGDAAFGFMLPVLAGFIAMSIGDRPALAVGFVGGALANAGGSGFLGALLAGFLAGYLVLLLRRIFDRLPASLEGIKPVLLYPVLGILIIGAAIVWLVNPPVSALNEMISQGLTTMGESSRIVAGILLGGMMSIDMGGPINKAAYVFGTASLVNAAGNAIASPFMAAVMAGGMVPPLAIALCTTFFPNRFTKKDRQSGLTNYIMGLSFITEGAIPFAAADPLRVIPACAVGSAVAGGLSMAFGCALRAPHGGLFVLSVVEHPLWYLGAVVVGAVVGALILAALKKPVKERI